MSISWLISRRTTSLTEQPQEAASQFKSCAIAPPTRTPMVSTPSIVIGRPTFLIPRRIIPNSGFVAHFLCVSLFLPPLGILPSVSATARRVLAALIVGLTIYVASDILFWQRIFESHALFQFDAQYQAGHLVVLAGMIALGIVLLWNTKLWALWYAAAFFTLAYSGLADVLYYWMDGKAIPNLCPWLDTSHPLILFHPAGGWTLVASTLIWIGFWAFTLFVPHLLRRLKPAVPAL
jgi:hypothetical protein